MESLPRKSLPPEHFRYLLVIGLTFFTFLSRSEFIWSPLISKVPLIPLLISSAFTILIPKSGASFFRK